MALRGPEGSLGVAIVNMERQVCIGVWTQRLAFGQDSCRLDTTVRRLVSGGMERAGRLALLWRSVFM
eukprot:3407405-Pleurochrysis_carterae.AAC.5